MALKMVKRLVLTPMALLSARRAVKVKPGSRRMVRMPNARSCQKLSSHGQIQTALASSRASVVFPMSVRAPPFAASMPRWNSISSASSASMRRRSSQYRRRRGNFVMVLLLCCLEYALDRVHHALEVGTFGSQLLAAGGGKGVETGPAVVFRCTPLRTHPAIEQEPLQRRIERAFAHIQDVFGSLFQHLRDAVSVHFATGERLEDQEVQRAGEEFECLLFSHRLSMEV